MPLEPNPESERDAALRLFCQTVVLAADALGSTSILRLLAWMEARSADPGGFLWLAATLGYRPAKMEEMIRSTLDATPRRRQAIGRKLKDVREPA